MVQEIKAEFAGLPPYPTITASYFIWRKPYMSVGQDTFIHQMLQAADFTNVFAHLNRYPEIAAADLQKSNPALILLSSEPYPFKEKHIGEVKEICPSAHVKLVDGELFSWYGSRIRKLPAYIRQLRQELVDLPVTL